MDSLDYEILAMLQADGRRAFTEIAKKHDVTEGTVRKRVARMIDEKVVKFIALAEPNKVGFEAPAIIQAKVAPNKLESAVRIIEEYPEVSYLLRVTGNYDLLIEVRCRNLTHFAELLHHRLQKIEGIEDTHTMMVLSTETLKEVDVREAKRD